ncbi:hypothetical protein PR202_ga28087 [Eleusine coracana subsp. coracana]|uniref:peptidylprolyl isomerase n=1 Tax=Eleusine coracana subsp. coracana TaxID=191504 RepID=A0AAV5DID3_ELECO|nr:hypothetical protein PR202_ga28087 [Eleusine coracana subsp. coracana]
MELSLLPSLFPGRFLPLASAEVGSRKAMLRQRMAFACRCCAADAAPGGNRRWFASLLAAAAVAGVGMVGGGEEAGAVSTSRRALRASKIPESEFTTLPNGLKYYDIKVGSGAEAVKGSRVAPYGFDVGNSERGNVLKGLDLGVEGMKVGGQRLLIVPPELAYGKKGVQEIPPNATIELDVELLSIKQSPFGLDVVTIGKRLDLPECVYENAYSTAGRVLISGFSRQASNAEELMETAASENPAEVAVNKVQDDLAMPDELATLKRLVSGLEERACSIEAQFHDYCDMKEQESAYQKMQIMCLGMKLELLESQNQRLEAAAVEIRAAAEEFAAMRGKLDRLQSKLNKITKSTKRDSDAVHKRILALDVKQAQMSRRCGEFEQCMEEMKQLTLQLQEQKGASNENVEVAVERSLRKLSSGRDLVDGLEALRDRWAADMEEMIYLGWITAWLQHELLLCDGDDGEFGTVVVGTGEDDGGSVEDEHPEEEHQKKKKGETMVAEVAPGNEVRFCKAASSSSSSSSSGVPPRRSVDGEPSCMGFSAAGGAGRIGGPRLLRKLRGWAGGKGNKGKKPCRIVGPCCQK